PAALAQTSPVGPGAHRWHAYSSLAWPRLPAAGGGCHLGKGAGLRCAAAGALPRAPGDANGGGSRRRLDPTGPPESEGPAPGDPRQAAAGPAGDQPGARRRGHLAGAVVSADQCASHDRGRPHRLVVLLAVADRTLLQAAQERRSAAGGVAAGVACGGGPALGGGGRGLRGGVAGGGVGGGGGGRVAGVVGAAERPPDETGRGLHVAGPAGRAVAVAGDDRGTEAL